MKCVIMKMEMLTNALRALSYEPFLEIFYRKMIKQLIWLTSFYIFHKSSIKNFRGQNGLLPFLDKLISVLPFFLN